MAAPLDPPQPDQRPTAAGRDAALARVRRTTRWLLAGGVAATSVFAGLAADATSSKATHANAGTSSTQTPAQTNDGTSSSTDAYGNSSSDDSGYDDGGSSYGYSAPPQASAQAPQATQSAPSAASGAS